jgi:chemotaxis response regulator CheB
LIEGVEGLRTHQVLPKGVSPLLRKSDTSSVSAGSGRSSKTSEIATAARQSEREDLSTAKAKAPRKRGTQRKDSISSVKTPSLHTLIAQPGSGSSAAPPDGEASQGPSPVDYNLEIEADFPKEMVLTMQENAAKKTRRTVIGRTLGGRATFKTLLDCLKLHLPAPLVSTTLFTRGYFEILFEDEDGAKVT